MSAGDLLRAERDSGSEHGDMINKIIQEGKIVPVAITCGLIKQAMEKSGWAEKKYLVDGFPRNEDNYTGWQTVMAETVNVEAVLWFDADEAIMTERILKRAETSGRNDDNIETLRKRFAQFTNEQMPIINRYADAGKVIKIDACRPVEDVTADLKSKMSAYL